MGTIDETMIKRNLEYIKLEWADIHHSRQQEWGALVAVAGIFYAIAQVEPDYPGNPLEAKIFLGLLGILSAFLGAWVCWQHHEILQQKISVIVKLERQIGIQYPVRNVWFPVQVLLFWLFGGICSAFVGLTLGYAAQALQRGYLQRSAYGVGFVVFLGFLGFAYFRRRKAVKSISYGFTHPYYAEMKDLDQCLSDLEDIPLKLVTGGTFDRRRIKEEVWKSPKWTYEKSQSGSSNLGCTEIIKPVFLNRRDMFEFSLASADSKQDCHSHKHVLEVYVSDDPIDLAYQEQQDGAKRVETVHVDRGVVIVPPGIPHRVKLKGRTFVFQAALVCQDLSGDKESCSKELADQLVRAIRRAEWPCASS
jgi:hypothetical protein